MKTPLWKLFTMMALVVAFCAIGIVGVQRENYLVYWLCFGSIYFGMWAWSKQ